MKSTFKVLFVSLIGGMFLFGGCKLISTEKYSVNSAKKNASYDLQYDPADCVSDTNSSLVPPAIVVYYDENGNEIWRCDNPLTPLVTSTTTCVDLSLYSDSSMTEPITGNKVGDIITTREITYEPGTQCVTGVHYITKVYAKCNSTCTNQVNKTYTIHYIVSGKEVASETREYGVNTTIMSNPTSGNFDGWYTDSQMTTKLSTNNTSALNIVEKKDSNNCVVGYEDVYLYGKPAQDDVCTTKINKTYTIHYVVSGKEVASETREYGVNTTIMSNPTSGNFDGWYTDSQMTTKLSTNNTSALNIVEKKDSNNCVVGYEDVYLYGKPVQDDVCTNEVNKEYTVYFIVDGKQVATDKRVYESHVGITSSPFIENLDGWYTDSQMTTKLSTNNTSALNIVEKKDSNNCVIGYEDVYLYGRTTQNINPDTGDNIIIYISLGIALILCSSIVVKKVARR